MKTSFIPRKDSELHSFEINFKTKLLLHAPALKLDPAVVAVTIETIETSINAYNKMVSKKSEAKSLYADYQIAKNEALKELRRMSKAIKASPSYTLAEGEDLQIISPKPIAADPSEMKPALKLTVNGHIVKIRFNKGKTSALNIYSRRGPETEFKFLAITLQVQFADKRENIEPGKPEKREYYAYYIEKDVEIGMKSDTVDALVP